VAIIEKPIGVERLEPFCASADHMEGFVFLHDPLYILISCPLEKLLDCGITPVGITIISAEASGLCNFTLPELWHRT
jgi:hypothetical protein